jgi:hypothetical protein
MEPPLAWAIQKPGAVTMSQTKKPKEGKRLKQYSRAISDTQGEDTMPDEITAHLSRSPGF